MKIQNISTLVLCAVTAILYQNCTPFTSIPAVTEATSSSSGSNSNTNSGSVATPSPVDPFSTDRKLFFGKSRCQGFLFCEDFESGTLSSMWQVYGRTPLVDSTEAARGTQALHITQTGLGFSAIHLSSIFPIVNNVYYGRLFVRYKSLPTPPLSYLHWELVGSSGTGSNAEIRIGGEWQDGKNRFNTGSDYGALGDSLQKDNDPPAFQDVPLNQWMCIEWLHDGVNNETKLWWDGVEHPSMATTLTKHGGAAVPDILPVTTGIYIGWNSHQPSSETYELFIDEIAFDRTRLGCVR